MKVREREQGFSWFTWTDIPVLFTDYCICTFCSSPLKISQNIGKIIDFTSGTGNIRDESMYQSGSSREIVIKMKKL